MNKIILLIILYSTASYLRAAVSPDDAKDLFLTIKSTLSLEILNRDIEINYFLKGKKSKPGAFSKWITVDKIGAITLTSSLLELQRMNKKILAIYLCHEFGHFLGGAPYIKSNTDIGIYKFRNHYKFMSAEGQADYFATTTCILPVFKVMRWEQGVINKKNLALCDIASSKCNGLLSIILDVLNSYAHILKKYYHREERFSPIEKSPYSVQTTLTNKGDYPDLQCRFDTMIAGITKEMRPSCWYKPRDIGP